MERDRPRVSHLPALAALAAAIVLWSLGEDSRRAAEALRLEIEASVNAASRMVRSAPTDWRSLALTRAGERERIESRLQSDEPASVVRAQTVAALRLACLEAMATNCVVRLSDERLASASPSAATRPDDGESLRMQSARAVVSGSFQRSELNAFLQRLHSDRARVWRVNGLTVRDNGFEADIERLFVPKA